MTSPRVVATNAAAVIEAPGLDANPYLIDADGHPFVPIGDGGIVLGLALGDNAFGFDTDHASPGVSVIHPDPSARAALTAFSCLGNQVVLRSGDAAGRRGVVLGKRGEQGRVLVWFPDDVMRGLVPGDSMAIRAEGQGWQLDEPLAGLGVQALNIDPRAMAVLPIDLAPDKVRVSVRGIVPSKLIGNGIGRPAHQWDLDLQVTASTAAAVGLALLAVGDLVAVADLDVRHNAGFRRGWVTVGVAVTTGSPRPGHGVGLMPILCGPATAVELDVDAVHHTGVTSSMLGELSGS